MIGAAIGIHQLPIMYIKNLVECDVVNSKKKPRPNMYNPSNGFIIV